MYGSKILTSGEIKNLKAKKYHKLDIVIYNDMAYFCKSSICRLSRKPDNLKAQINRYVRTTNDSSITIKRADAYHAVNTTVMAIFADYSIKASQLSFVTANVALDALEVSTDDKRLKLIDLITESANNLDSLKSNIDPRIAKLERSEAKHEIAERQSAATISELRQKLDKSQTKLAESKRENDELVVENVMLHNKLNTYPVICPTEPTKLTFVERVKALFK